MYLLLTGAGGFLGTALVARLASNARFELIAASRQAKVQSNSSCRSVSVGDVNADTDWTQVVAGVDVIIHGAARVHVMKTSRGNELAEFCKVNVDGSLNLARQAAKARVKRFIFISTIKVNGEATPTGKSFSADDQVAPEDAYAISKMEAEKGLQKIALETGMEVVIIRSPLVYGPGVKANFETMLRCIDAGLPLPLGSIDNKRSLVALDNLVDLTVTCIDHPAAANQIFLVADGEDVSTTELLRRIARALDKNARLISCPASVLMLIASVFGKRDVMQRLTASLQVDISRARSLLGWSPPVSMDQALRLTAEDFRQRKARSHTE